MWTILKSLLNLFYHCFCFMFFGHRACGLLAPRPGMEPALPALEGEALTPGLPGKSPTLFKILGQWGTLSFTGAEVL